MSRIAILSDAHLLIQAERFRDENYRSPRGEISLENFNRVISQVIAEQPEAVILAGDMFDEREKGGEWVADSEAAKYWPEIRNELERLIAHTTYGVYALRGNHDSGSVLKELEDHLGDGFHFVRDEERDIGDHRVYFLETRYRQGSYRIPVEQLPGEGEILIMHETLPWGGIPGLEEELFQELSRRFCLLFDGHMHHFARSPLDIPNFYALPALIPSRELKNAFTVKYEWPGDLDNPEAKDSPFGYVILDGNDISFQRYAPIQSIVKVEIKGNSPAEVVTGVNEVYSALMKREDRDKLWVWISARGVMFRGTVTKETNKYPEINTLDDIDIQPRKEDRKSVELRGLDKVITLSELEAKALASLAWRDRDLAESLFDEIFTAENLSRRADSNLQRFLFQKLLELAAPHYGVSPERLNSFLLRVDPLWKRR
ncbi:MAG: metallophosphoesterase [Chloroflexi bacterium]|nr:metallophosphoesterase [Chloroflexota bacterium]